MADPVELTDLNVITRYSIAVRAATAERAELIRTLRADLDWLEAGRPDDRRSPRKESVEPTPAAKKSAATRVVRAAKKAPVRRSR